MHHFGVVLRNKKLGKFAKLFINLISAPINTKVSKKYVSRSNFSAFKIAISDGLTFRYRVNSLNATKSV